MGVLNIGICEDCGKPYQATPNTHYCEACRRRRFSENARKLNLNRLGNKANSERAKERMARAAQLSEENNVQ